MRLAKNSGLEDFGLPSRADLARLGSRKVTVEILWTPPPVKSHLQSDARQAAGGGAGKWHSASAK